MCLYLDRSALSQAGKATIVLQTNKNTYNQLILNAYVIGAWAAGNNRPTQVKGLATLSKKFSDLDSVLAACVSDID
jgi:hypothetical protein